MTKEGIQISVKRSPGCLPSLPQPQSSQQLRARHKLGLCSLQKLSVKTLQPSDAATASTADTKCLTQRIVQPDSTFSSTIAAKKINNFMTERLRIAAPRAGVSVPKSQPERDPSSGNHHSQQQAENKQSILVHTTKAPKLGIHLKSLLDKNRFSRGSARSSATNS